jgi:hypothetical protein
MSQENVELVLGLYPPPGEDYVQLFGNDSLWTEQAEAMAPFLHEDFDCVQHEFGGAKRYVGLDGLRAFLLDWMAPWACRRRDARASRYGWSRAQQSGPSPPAGFPRGIRDRD